MKKIFVLAIIIGLFSMGYRSLKKEQCSVVHKFEVENSTGKLEKHILLKFIDGTIQDEIVSDKIYRDIKELDFFYAVKQ
jgi:hypothetical protein